jgi:hypothetical protein
MVFSFNISNPQFTSPSSSGQTGQTSSLNEEYNEEKRPHTQQRQKMFSVKIEGRQQSMMFKLRNESAEQSLNRLKLMCSIQAKEDWRIEYVFENEKYTCFPSVVDSWVDLIDILPSMSKLLVIKTPCTWAGYISGKHRNFSEPSKSQSERRDRTTTAFEAFNITLKEMSGLGNQSVRKAMGSWGDTQVKLIEENESNSDLGVRLVCFFYILSVNNIRRIQVSMVFDQSKCDEMPLLWKDHQSGNNHRYDIQT